jgi:hypothetical protein
VPGVVKPTEATATNLPGLSIGCDGQVVETPIEARAGFLDRPVLVVLVVSVLLAVGAFLVISVGVF